jgi:hypothetical protein
VSTAFSKHIARNTALCAILASSVALPFTAFAQSDDGGFLMTLRLAERFISRDTTGPDTSVTGITNQAITDVALSISSETRTEALNVDLGGGYRFVDSPTSDGFAGEFTDPSLRLSYTQQAAASAITVIAFASRTDLDNATTLDTASATDGTLDPDFADLTQAGGNRNRLRFDAKLTLRDDAPFGLNFAVKVDDISYDNLPTGSALTDYTYSLVRAGARFDISEVMQANVSLHFSQTSGADTYDRYGIDAGLILTQPNGQITADLSATDGDDGSQTHLSLGRSFTTEDTTTRFGLGVSQASTDDVFVTGSASIKHTFADESPLGTFTASADRRLTREGRSDEDLVTSLSVAASYALTPVANLRLSAGFAQSEDIVSGDTVDLSQANLSVSYALDPNWTATAGVGVQSRDPSTDTATESTTLSLGLSRTFDLRR